MLLVAFDGSLDHLIPLYAVGVFTSFTLSQAGMVVHWRRARGPGWRRAAVVNGVGAVATGDRDAGDRQHQVRCTAPGSWWC